MRKNHFIITPGALRGILIAFVLILFGYGWSFYLQHRENSTVVKLGVISRNQAVEIKTNRRALKTNRRAIIYICSTTSVLDRLVTQQANQIKTNFANGTYERLLKAGLITQSNIKQARMTLTHFESSHRKLTERSACSDSAIKPPRK